MVDIADWVSGKVKTGAVVTGPLGMYALKKPIIIPPVSNFTLDFSKTTLMVDSDLTPFYCPSEQQTIAVQIGRLGLTGNHPRVELPDCARWDVVDGVEQGSDSLIFTPGDSQLKAGIYLFVSDYVTTGCAYAQREIVRVQTISGSAVRLAAPLERRYFSQHGWLVDISKIVSQNLRIYLGPIASVTKIDVPIMMSLVSGLQTLLPVINGFTRSGGRIGNTDNFDIENIQVENADLNSIDVGGHCYGVHLDRVTRGRLRRGKTTKMRHAVVVTGGAGIIMDSFEDGGSKYGAFDLHGYGEERVTFADGISPNGGINLGGNGLIPVVDILLKNMNLGYLNPILLYQGAQRVKFEGSNLGSLRFEPNQSARGPLSFNVSNSTIIGGSYYSDTPIRSNGYIGNWGVGTFENSRILNKFPSVPELRCVKAFNAQGGTLSFLRCNFSPGGAWAIEKDGTWGLVHSECVTDAALGLVPASQVSV